MVVMMSITCMRQLMLTLQGVEREVVAVMWYDVDGNMYEAGDADDARRRVRGTNCQSCQLSTPTVRAATCQSCQFPIVSPD